MVREARITLACGPLRYLEAGAGWPLVLLHAFPLSADMWRPQLEQVPAGWRLVAPDLRGFGGAADSSAVESIEDLADGVFQLLDALAFERAAIGGLSMGGYVAFAMIRREPARFSQIVLADTRATADTPAGREARKGMLAALDAGGPAAVADLMLPKLLGESSRTEQPELENRVRRMIETNDAAGIAGGIRAMMDRSDSTPLLDQIGVPSLIIVGDEDVLTPPADSEAMAARLRRSRLVKLPRAGHLSSLEAPRDFSVALSDFLTSPL
jgi:3-oxoadipate enol-lactonase